MGSTYSYISDKNWYVYGRRIDTDGYEHKPFQEWKNIDKKTALGRFKHEIYAYSLQRYNYTNNTKAIYLYYGSTRIAKACIMNNQLVVESNYDLQQLLEAREQLAAGRSPYLFQTFKQKWFQNYARLNVNSVGWVLQERRSVL